MFSQNSFSQFGSNYSPQFGQNSNYSNPEDGMSGARTQQTPGMQGLQQFSNEQQSPQGGLNSTIQNPNVTPVAIKASTVDPTASSTSGAAVPSPTAGMTWTQMQQNGYARPPYPASDQSVGATVASTPTSPLETSLTNAYQNYQGIGQFQDPNTVTSSAGNGNTFATPTPLAQSTQASVQNLVNNPSPYLSDAYQSQLQKTMGQIDDQYNTADQELHSNIASRGLDTGGTIGATDQRYNNLMRRSAQTDGATNLLNQLASTYGTDRTNAINTSLGYGNQQYNQAQGTFATNAAANAQNFGQNQTNLQNLLGYGNQSFQNQLQTATLNNNQNNAQTQLLLQLLGAGYTA